MAPLWWEGLSARSPWATQPSCLRLRSKEVELLLEHLRPKQPLLPKQHPQQKHQPPLPKPLLPKQLPQQKHQLPQQRQLQQRQLLQRQLQPLQPNLQVKRDWRVVSTILGCLHCLSTSFAGEQAYSSKMPCFFFYDATGRYLRNARNSPCDSCQAGIVCVIRCTYGITFMSLRPIAAFCTGWP